jgi:hypothetical protein
MPEYTISWTINLDGENPEDAASNALAIMLDEHSISTVFDVTDASGNQTRIDLLGILPCVKRPKHQRDLKMAVVLEGGIVQSIIADQPDRLPDNILVIDYDNDGWEEDDLAPIVQDNGSQALAHVYQISPELPRIDLDALFSD